MPRGIAHRRPAGRANPPTRGLSWRSLEQISETLRVLAHPLRLKLLERLQGEPMSVSTLAAQVRCPQPSVSQHLNHLRRQGLVIRQRRGREVYYSVNDRQAATVLDWLYRRRVEDATFEGGEAI